MVNKKCVKFFITINDLIIIPRDLMKPCRDCMKVYGDGLCSTLGHCVFEGTNEKPETIRDSKIVTNESNTLSPKEVCAS